MNDLLCRVLSPRHGKGSSCLGGVIPVSQAALEQATQTRRTEKGLPVEQKVSAHFPQDGKEEAGFPKGISAVGGETASVRAA